MLCARTHLFYCSFPKVLNDWYGMPHFTACFVQQWACKWPMSNCHWLQPRLELEILALRPHSHRKEGTESRKPDCKSPVPALPLQVDFRSRHNAFTWSILTSKEVAMPQEHCRGWVYFKKLCIRMSELYASKWLNFFSCMRKVSSKSCLEIGKGSAGSIQMMYGSIPGKSWWILGAVPRKKPQGRLMSSLHQLYEISIVQLLCLGDSE